MGKRKGLNIGGTEDKMFVVGKDLKKNILYICIVNSKKYNSMENIKELTKAEEQVMQVLWKIESGFENEIMANFPEPKPS